MSTILFYDVVLASQGVEALEWTELMNTDPMYATIFNKVFTAYSGIKVKLLGSDGHWVEKTSIGDTGPIAWKEIAVELPLERTASPEIVTIRLEFFPDNVSIDYVGWEPGGKGQTTRVTEIPPATVRDDAGSERDDVRALVAAADGELLVTEPGESLYFEYDLAPTSDGETTLFVKSRGYYVEWLRGEWLNPPGGGYRFSLLGVEEAISQLVHGWAQNRSLMEKTFRNTRINLVGES